MKPREYCCCAIPMVNAGIYATLIEQFAAGILIGALSVATPSIVGAATPSFAPWLLGIICFVAAGLQVLGFIGVAKEKPVLYRRYVTLHGIILGAALAIAAAWIIVSATRHSTASSNCIQKFFSDETLQTQGERLCEIFSWVDVGIMGGLWALLAILQGYLLFVVSSYGAAQRRDHLQYDTVNDPTHPLTKDAIPMADRSDPWDSRQSPEPAVPEGDHGQYRHLRQLSTASASDILNQPHQHPSDSLSSDYGYKSYHNATEEKLEHDYPFSRPPHTNTNSNDGYYQTSYQTRPAHSGGLI